MKTQSAKTRSLPAGEFKANCLGLLDEVREGKVRLTVTNTVSHLLTLCHTFRKRSRFDP